MSSSWAPWPISPDRAGEPHDAPQWSESQSQPREAPRRHPAGTSPIVVGDGQVIGSVRVDPASLDGANVGGRPHLIVPLAVTIHNRPAASTVGLVGLETTIGRPGGDVLAYGLHLDLINGMPCRSTPDGNGHVAFPVHFPVELDDFSALELERQDRIGTRSHGQLPHDPGEPVNLEVRFAAHAAALVTSNDDRLGPRSFLAMFWSTQILPLVFPIDHGPWMKSVMPAFKDRLRRGR